MRSWLLLGLAVALAGCDDGGSSGPPPIPVPPWGNFRHDVSNSASSSVIDSNTGTVSSPIQFPTPHGVTDSTPTIDLDGNILIGTTHGVLAYDPGCFQFKDDPPPDPARCPIWTVTECTLPTDTGPVTVPVGSVSASATVTAGGTVIFTSDGSDGIGGHLFAVQEPGDAVVCNFVYPPPGGGSFTTKSSAATLINAVDLSLASVFVGGDDGVVRALNADGTLRWSFPTAAVGRPISSSPAIDATSTVYLQTPDGMLAAINAAGRTTWQARVGAVDGSPFQPSPGVGTSVYAVGTSGMLVAVNVVGGLKWQFDPPRPIRGSLAFIPQSFNQGSQALIDTIIYVVDVDGKAYGVRDLTGRALQMQGCSNNLTLDCTFDSCAPTGVCNPDSARCSMPEGQPCVQDSCLPEGACGVLGRCSNDRNQVCIVGDACTPDGTCEPLEGFFVAGDTVQIDTSPVLSADPFVVIGTPDGRVCARGLDGTVPGQDLTPPTDEWMSGCINLPNAQPTRSTPIIGPNGQIYVTTDDGFYAIQ